MTIRFNTMVTATATKNTITLKGSTDTVSEFFQYALSSILYQRGVYPAENFEPQKKYGLTVMAVRDAKLCSYLQSVLRQFSGKFVVNIKSLAFIAALCSSYSLYVSLPCCRVAEFWNAAKSSFGGHQCNFQRSLRTLDI